MPLKRGLERESCDFCFRRKIKCDRSSRAASGLPTCSQCDWRQTRCTFECDDIRIQRKQKSSPKKRMLGVSMLTETNPVQRTKYTLTSDNESASPGNSALPLGNATSPLQLHDAATTTASNVSRPSSSGSTVVLSTQSSVTVSQLPPCPDFAFELSPNSLAFLDSIFPDAQDTPEVASQWNNMPSLSLQSIDGPQEILSSTQSPYFCLDIPAGILDTAIDAYFNFFSLSLSFLTRDGFMADYKAHRGSPALVFAVACRGCPFVRVAEKWSLQQRLASRFRKSFLQARGSTSSSHIVKLDDLEALALMVDFEYETPEGTTTSLQSQLESLLLTHDSLVVMTLQYRIDTCMTTEAGLSTTLSRAAQRQALLFWYVYGWDAFHSLDIRMNSRIQDEDVYLSEQLHGHENQSYFDAILGLAVVARKMTKILCSPVAKRKGARHQDIESLYNQLREWRTNDCPPAFNIQCYGNTTSLEEVSLPLDIGTQHVSPIHAAIVTLLELNCYMQLDACVSQYGIEESGSSMGHIVDTRVKYETLQAAHKIVNVAEWIRKLTASEMWPTPTTMPDLSPGVIRNICVGAHNWIYRNAKEMLHIPHLRISNIELAESGVAAGNRIREELSTARVKSWVDSLTILRDIAATASSHRDTGPSIERLDGQMRALKTLLSSYDGQ
ncbi:hypothetical protein F5B22DRAFT_590051 [Xylaria bambusicola]|uniref:uncharacterized protein n=1 Tax=Xylaria bambusicola TaxID=326684 RepID=UPI00200758FE|nr:uncharacterized protein F5B22DRAFT_590051 [Xylaria bambusicola]KAI0525462.1 hypothetical protein F5B22DRAFT_590051 [Xylaria bambusicola]